MIIGIGTDIVNINRIEHIFQKYSDRFLKKNFHPLEIEKYNSLEDSLKTAYLAKRFAGKEAFSKALGTGIGDHLAFCDIAIVNNELGAPQILLPSKKHLHIAEHNIHISLSDDYPFAVAFVVISK